MACRPTAGTPSLANLVSPSEQPTHTHHLPVSPKQCSTWIQSPRARRLVIFTSTGLMFCLLTFQGQGRVWSVKIAKSVWPGTRSRPTDHRPPRLTYLVTCSAKRLKKPLLKLFLLIKYSSNHAYPWMKTIWPLFTYLVTCSANSWNRNCSYWSCMHIAYPCKKAHPV